MGWRGILGYDYGIVLAPLGPDISGPQLVSAVANAGGLGFLRAPDWEAPDYLRDLIRQTRALTEKPFGVGVVLAFPHEANIKVILEEKVDVLQVYWGECSKKLVDRAHSAGAKIVPQVGSAEEAKRVIDAGVDALIVQGREAGGHVIGQESLISLLPRVVDIVGDREIPVIAAGGIADGRGYVAALALGASGVCLGTRFVATKESNAHPSYKQKLVEYDKTEYTTIFGRARWPGAPHRVLRTPVYEEWKSIPDDENETSHPVIGHLTIHGMEKEIRRLAGTVPNASAKGEVESMVMYAGEGVGLITEILPAQEVVERLVEEARTLIQTTFQLQSK